MVRRIPSFQGNRKVFENMRAKVQKYLLYRGEDDRAIDAVAATMISNVWRDTPPSWLLYLAPPGSGKTALVTLFQDPRVVALSSLTPNSLISGWRDSEGTDHSLLKKLNNRILVLKDFTAILTMSKEARDAIVGALRDAYDGEASKSFGNIGLMSYKSRFTVIGCVTPAYEHYYSITQQLGERFLLIRLRSIDPREVGARAVKHLTGTNPNFAPARQACSHFLARMVVPRLEEFHATEEFESRIVDLADLCAALRSHIYRDGRTRVITSAPSRETPGRLVKQLWVQAAAYACCISSLEVGERCYSHARRLALDTLPEVSHAIMKAAYELSYLTASGIFNRKQLRIRTKLGSSTVNTKVEDFIALGLFIPTGKSTSGPVKIDPTVRDQIRSCELWKRPMKRKPETKH